MKAVVKAIPAGRAVAQAAILAPTWPSTWLSTWRLALHLAGSWPPPGPPPGRTPGSPGHRHGHPPGSRGLLHSGRLHPVRQGGIGSRLALAWSRIRVGHRHLGARPSGARGRLAPPQGRGGEGSRIAYRQFPRGRESSRDGPPPRAGPPRRSRVGPDPHPPGQGSAGR